MAGTAIALLLMVVGAILLRSPGDGNGGEPDSTARPIQTSTTEGVPETTSNQTTIERRTTSSITETDGESEPLVNLASSYRGTATLTVEIYDFCNPRFERQLADTVQFEAPVEVTFGQPSTDGQQTETNPRQMTVSFGEPGSWSMFLISAGVATTPETGRDLLLQYWDLGIDGGSLSGVLIDDHRREGAAHNSLSSLDPLVPCQPNNGGLIPIFRSVAVGTELSGDVSGSHLQMLVEGSTYDDLRPFRIIIDATA